MNTLAKARQSGPKQSSTPENLEKTAFPFVKMHGLGNCFVLMNDRGDEVSGKADPRVLSKSVCDRNFGIGADGLILVKRSASSDLRMQILNEDGSEAEMCGNGIRCFARFAADKGISTSSELNVETLAGIVRTKLLDNGLVEVDMGEPRLSSGDVTPKDGFVKNSGKAIRVEERGRLFTFVSMGNPHAVAFVDGFDFDWKAEGAEVERTDSFPNRTNVHFAKIVGPSEVEVKVWERGCGETMACGTGACAVAVAGAVEGLLPRAPITVRLPGGRLSIHWNDTGRVMMTGSAAYICEGTYLF